MHKNTKRQHYIPQFYLKYFASGRSKIYVYDKLERNSFVSNVKDVGQERYFYEVPIVDGVSEEIAENNLNEKTMVEDALQFYDNLCADELHNIVRNIRASKYISSDGKYLFNLTDQQKMGISFFAALLDARTKESRESISQQNYLFAKSTLDMVAKMTNEKIDPSLIDIDVDSGYDSAFHAQMLLNEDHMEGIARVCTYSRLWFLGVNKTDSPLFISDHPIVKRSHDPHPFYRSAGWCSPYLELAIPLDPEFIIILLCPSIYRNEFKRTGWWPKNNSIFELSDENIAYYNSLQCQSSYRYVYSPQDEWDLVEDYISDFPRSTDPFRQRIRIDGGGVKVELPKDWSERQSRRN